MCIAFFTQITTKMYNMKFLIALLMCTQFTGCSTALAVADGVGTAAVYTAKTVINTVDAITPDVVNKEKK